jgi:Escherichia/Staphylococcus phage prohead protease
MPSPPTSAPSLIQRALLVAQFDRQLRFDVRGTLRRLPTVRAAFEEMHYDALLDLHHAEVRTMRRILALRRLLNTDPTRSRQTAWRAELAEAERQLNVSHSIAPPAATLGPSRDPLPGEPPTHRGTVERRRHDLERVEVRAAADGALRFSGYAALFDSPTWIGQPGVESGFQESLHPGAFAKTLADKADVRLLFNHDPSMVLARTKSGTLTLAEDRTGLKVDATLAPTQAGKDLAVLLERGDVSQMSFGFRVVTDEWSTFKGADGADYQRRLIREVKLFDVSAVTYPAYDDTTASVAAAKLVKDRRLLAQAA